MNYHQYTVFMLYLSFGVIKTSKSFYIRNYQGQCAQYNDSQGILTWSSICKDKFKWKGGIRLIDNQTSKCLIPKTGAGETSVTLTDDCSNTNTMFQQLAANGAMRHMISGKCIRSDNTTNGRNQPLSMVANCMSENSGIWLINEIMYTIRHFNGFCWVYNSGDRLMNLVNTSVCDRFIYLSGKNLQHVKTRKCVASVAGDLALVDSCSIVANGFEVTENNNLYQTHSQKCVRSEGTSSPPSGSKLTLDTCDGTTSSEFYLHDDRGVLNVKLMSETCGDIPTGTDCGESRAHVLLNGYQYSLNNRGINVVVLDYRSGLLEHRSSYGVLLDVAARDTLASLLNNLPDGKILFMVAKDAIKLNDNLATALLKHGVSATFATASIANDRRSLAAIAYTGKTRKEWEESVNRFGGTGASAINKTIYLFHEWRSRHECSAEMGLRTKQIPDAKLTASSVLLVGGNYEAKNARLYDTGWCAGTNAPVPHFLQIDLGTMTMLTGIAMQPGGPHSYSVPNFILQVSLEGMIWSDYSEGSGSKTFVGPKPVAGETRVNWFSKTFARFIRVKAVTGSSSNAITPCLKIELFGCYPEGPIFKHIIPFVKNSTVIDYRNERFSLNGFAPDSKKIQIRVSTAPSFNNLSLENFGEQQFTRIDEVTIFFGGNVMHGVTKIVKEKNESTKIATSGFIDYTLNATGYYNFKVGLGYNVLDTGAPSNINRWTVYSYATDEQIVVMGLPFTVKRAPNDASKLSIHVNNSNHKEVYKNGDTLRLTISIAHVHGESRARAYSISFALAYDGLLRMRSVKNIQKDTLSIAPTRNSTRPGSFTLHTDVLSWPNNHFIQLDLQFNLPKEIPRSCKAYVVVDWKYITNLAKYNGKMEREVGSLSSYNCTNFRKRPAERYDGRIAVPEFSMLFDDVNNDLYVCKQKNKSAQENIATCYLRKRGDASWISLPQISSLVGIDSSIKALYGIDLKGKSYVKSIQGSSAHVCVDDMQWTSIQNQPNVRKAKTIANVTSLPSNPSTDWIFPSVSNPLWAATKTGVMQRNAGIWKKVMEFL